MFVEFLTDSASRWFGASSAYVREGSRCVRPPLAGDSLLLRGFGFLCSVKNHSQCKLIGEGLWARRLLAAFRANRLNKLGCLWRLWQSSCSMVLRKPSVHVKYCSWFSWSSSCGFRGFRFAVFCEYGHHWNGRAQPCVVLFASLLGVNCSLRCGLTLRVAFACLLLSDKASCTLDKLL